MKKKVFSVKKFLIFIFILCLIVCGTLVGGYFYLVGHRSSNTETITINIKKGNSYGTIGPILKENGLIKSELVYKIYVKLNKPENLEAGDYVLKKSYNMEEIIDTLKKGSVNLASTKKITFVEGKNMRYIISNITSTFNITEKEILDKLSDSKYLDSLISKYWFLTDDIKNKDIYYSLEGYLYPDTYEFYETATIEDIFKGMLDNMNNKISKYKEEVKKSKYSIHEMMTLASIIELEAGTASDRKGVAGVFYNRLKDNWSLGSDVTTYYAEKIDNYSRDLKMSELNSCNKYNTRSTCMAGKLPISPICNPGLESIVAAFEPTKHNYYYFVADKNGKTYFTKTYNEHNNKCNQLKRDGLWINYTS